MNQGKPVSWYKKRDEKSQSLSRLVGIVCLFLLMSGLLPFSSALATNGVISSLGDCIGGVSASKCDEPFTAVSFELQFEPNLGQFDERVRYAARGRGYTVALTEHEAVLVLKSGVTTETGVEKNPSDVANHGRTLTIRPVGALASSLPSIKAEGLQKGVTHYLQGKRASDGIRNVPQHMKVTYHNVYPGIDLTYYGKNGQLEYDYIVTPGRDPKQIRIGYSGIGKMDLLENGDLRLTLAEGKFVTQKAPVIYQESDGRRDLVAGSYELLGNNEIGFSIGTYDRSRSLIIDPVVDYSGYLGGIGSDTGADVTSDAAGNVYVIGSTDSSAFPPNASASTKSTFVSKFDPSGQLVATLIYSLATTGTDEGRAIDLHPNGNVVFAGRSIPTSFFGYADYVAVLGPDLTFQSAFSTFFVGSNAFDMSIGSDGKVWVVGQAVEPFGFSTTLDGYQQVFRGEITGAIRRFSITGDLEYSSLLGGVASSEYNSSERTGARSVYVNEANDVFIVGRTNSTAFPQTIGTSPGSGFHTFVTKFNAAGALLWSTLIPGNSNTGSVDANVSAAAVVGDGAGGAWVSGQTSLTGIATAGALDATLSAGGDGFLAHLDAAGAKIYGTYLGGIGTDVARAVARDSFGAIWVAGGSDSSDFPVTNDAFSSTPNGFDAFLVGLTGVGQQVYGTFIGGNNADEANGVTTTTNGKMWLSGTTASPNFPIVGGGLASSVQGGTTDAFLVAVNGFTAPGIPSINSPAPASVLSAGQNTFTWTDNGASVSEYWLYIGAAAGAATYVDSGSLGTTLSFTATGLPSNGSAVYIRLWYRLSGDATWYSTDSTYTAATGGALTLTSPAPGATLSATSAQFTWLDSGLGIVKYWLYAGSTIGGAEYFSSGDIGTATAATIAGLPVNGSPVQIRLWYQVSSDATWYWIDATYTAATLAAPSITSPVLGSMLVGPSQSFQWADNGAGALDYWLYAGSVVGGVDYFNQNMAQATSTTVTGLPTDGSTVHVRLWYKSPAESAWSFVDATYIALDAGPKITSPVPGAVLNGASQSFTWTDNGVGVDEWWVYAGSGAGVADYFDSGSLGSATSGTVSGLPADGSTVSITLWYRQGVLWQFKSYSYTSSP